MNWDFAYHKWDINSENHSQTQRYFQIAMCECAVMRIDISRGWYLDEADANLSEKKSSQILKKSDIWRQYASVGKLHGWRRCCDVSRAELFSKRTAYVCGCVRNYVCILTFRWRAKGFVMRIGNHLVHRSYFCSIHQLVMAVFAAPN